MSISPSLNGHRGSGAPARARSRFARNIPVYYLFYGASGFLIWLPIWIIYLQDQRGMSLTQVASMEAIFWITIVVAEVPTGAIADRWGRRVSLLLGGILFTIATVVFAFAESFAMLAINYLIMAIAMTLHSGAGHALLFDTLRQLGRTNEYEKHVGRSEAASFASMLAATMLGGAITALVGYQVTILIGAGSMALAGSIALFLREPPRSEAEFASANGRGADSPVPAQRRSVLGNMLAGALVVWRRKPLLWIILFATLIVVVAEMPDFLLQPFVRLHGVDPTVGVGSGFAYSSLLVPPIAGMVIGSLVAASVVSRFGEHRALPFLLIAAAVIFVPLLAWDSLWVIAAIAMLACVRGMIRPIVSGYINRRIASDQRATVLSMFELAMGLMMALVVPLAGTAADLYSFQASYALCLVILVVGGGLFAIIWRRSHSHEQTEAGITLNSHLKPQATTPPTDAASSTDSTAATLD